MRDEIFYAHAPTDDSLEMSRLWKGRYDDGTNISEDPDLSSFLIGKAQGARLFQMQNKNDQSRNFLKKGLLYV